MSAQHELVAGSTAGSPLGKLLDIRCIDIAEDEVLYRMPFASSKTTVGDMVHGGAIAALVDTAATAAAWSSSKLPENPRGTTIGFSINYLSGAHSTDLDAKAKIIRRGGSVVIVGVDVFGAGDAHIATATVTYKLSGKRK